MSGAADLANLLAALRTFIEQRNTSKSDLNPILAGTLVSAYNTATGIDFSALVQEAIAYLEEVLAHDPHRHDSIYLKLIKRLKSSTQPAAFTRDSREFLNQYLSTDTIERLRMWDWAIQKTRPDQPEISADDVLAALGEIETFMENASASEFLKRKLSDDIQEVRKRISHASEAGYLPVFSAYLKLMNVFFLILSLQDNAQQSSEARKTNPVWARVFFYAFVTIGHIGNVMQIESWISDRRYVPYVQIISNATDQAKTLLLGPSSEQATSSENQ